MNQFPQQPRYVFTTIEKGRIALNHKLLSDIKEQPSGPSEVAVTVSEKSLVKLNGRAYKKYGQLLFNPGKNFATTVRIRTSYFQVPETTTKSGQQRTTAHQPATDDKPSTIGLASRTSSYVTLAPSPTSQSTSSTLSRGCSAKDSSSFFSYGFSGTLLPTPLIV